MRGVPSESLKIPDINKTSLIDIPEMAKEGKIPIEPDPKVPNYLSR